MKSNSVANCFLWVVSFLVIAFLTGCATTQSADWSSRVGHYTYAQAVNELGPPNRQIRLSNGATEFKWFLQPATGTTSINRTGINYNGMNNDFDTGPASTGFSNHYLLLTFDANGMLTAWSKN